VCHSWNSEHTRLCLLSCRVSPGRTAQLLVLIKRLGLDIPSEEELDELLTEYDDDENGLISFDELCKLAYNLGVDRTADSLEGEQTSFRRALGAYLKERRSIVLWRTIFDEIDKFPSDGLIDASELALAFGVLDGPDLDQEKLRRLMRKYDKDGNDKLDYEECEQPLTLTSTMTRPLTLTYVPSPTYPHLRSLTSR
jgi:Ca2+-binding EF-hand superfamily protein